MATITLASIAPTTGPTAGLTLCRIQGTGFRLPPNPPPTGPVTVPAPTVRVRFDGRASDLVLVLSPTLLVARAPSVRFPLPQASAVDVLVENLDAAGAPVFGEQATLSAAYTYAMPDLATAAEPGLTYLVRTLLDEWAKQVIPNVSTSTNTDYDDNPEDGLNKVALAKLPALVIGGPTLRLNRFYSLNQQRQVSAVEGWRGLRPPYTVDLVFTVLGVSDHKGELLGLLTEAQLFLNRNNYLVLPSVAGNPASAPVRYEMDVEPGGDLRVTSTPNNSNIHSFTGSFLIRGFDLDDLDMAQVAGGIVGSEGASLSTENTRFT